MRFGEHAEEMRCRAAKAHFPPRQRKNFTRRANLYRTLAQRRNRQGRDMLASIKNHMLPHFIGEQYRIMLHTKTCQKFQILARQNNRRRVDRIVQKNEARFICKRCRQHRFVKAPIRWLQRHEFRYAARTQHQRQIGVIHRLEQNHLVTRRDQRHQRARNRLGSARGDHHLVFPIERHALMMRVMFSDGLSQLRQAGHWRVLVPPVHHGVSRFFQHIERTGAIGKALAKINRAGFTRQFRHGFKNRGLDI